MFAGLNRSNNSYLALSLPRPFNCSLRNQNNVAINLLQHTVQQVVTANRMFSPTTRTIMEEPRVDVDDNDTHNRPNADDRTTDDEYAVISDPGNQRFYVERLFNRQKTLLDLSHRLFLYNTTDDEHRRECNNFMLNCPFVREGPHRPIRLNLAASTMLLTLTENGFVVERRSNNGSSFFQPIDAKEELELTDCATYVVCRFCRVSLINVHILNLVLAHRTNTIFSLLQRNAHMMRSGTLSNIDLYALYTEHTNLSVRSKLSKVLRKAHRSNCVYLDRAFNQELVFDAMSANRMLNAQLMNRCETCLISLIEHDVNCSMQLDDIVNSCANVVVENNNDRAQQTEEDATSAAATADQQDTVNPATNETDAKDGESDVALLLVCKCCLTKRARVNVPCGHLFQCHSCERLLRRSNQTPFRNAPCPVCRSPVLVTSEIFL